MNPQHEEGTWLECFAVAALIFIMLWLMLCH